MSIRRKSCEPCFKSRRKCDLTYPACKRCQQNSKRCHYVYPPQLSVDSRNATNALSSGSASNTGQPSRVRDGRNTLLPQYHDEALQVDEMRPRTVPRLLGRLGELPPVSGTMSLGWIFDRLRDCPLVFARQAETLFIHRDLFRDSFPRPLRAAFGICAGCAVMNERNQSTLFHALDAEMLELLPSTPTSTLLEDLVRLQAAVLYEIVRLFYGGLEQRIVAERQEYLIRSHGLKLLQRADAELGNAPRTWESWVLAESVRRTVVIAFKLYTTYSTFRGGTCTEIAALSILPVSTRPNLWSSRDAYLQHPDRDETTTYGDFSCRQAVASRGNRETFEKMLVLGCTGEKGPSR
ncbi:Zn(2)-C6 fungal-type DNA-binding domain-containing protein [Pleurostoma richardsiae]|uniref:Zn(2)-C6 fungal-type DNA-binding domain-containing protein n=1 Tax=Pleurostoma richardsiae TaxID=41990 RepID=A0AA38RFH7_9PEZI|nr:Zn(2)-C6 fungal-type DNA-binding domain-containing protein [Pleurostoma richardsiae]